MQEMRVLSLGQEDPLEKEMAIHSGISEYLMDRGAWRATVHGATKESDMTWQLNKNNLSLFSSREP